MRILFCNYEYPPLGGGGGVINALLAHEMAKRHEVTVLTSQALGLPRESAANGLRVVRVPVFFRTQEAVANLPSMLAFMVLGVRVGRQLVRANQFDVINTHFVLPSGPVGDALARVGRVPHVITLHGGDLYDPSKFMSAHRHPGLRLWVRRLLRRAQIVVGDSTSNLENMRRFYAPEIPGVRISLGIPRPEPGAAPRARYGCGDDEVLLVTVGRLVARKAIPQLIAMIDTLRGEPVRLLVIGTGPEEHTLKEQCRERQLSHRIVFLGHVEEAEKFRILRMCDLYVSTSQHEGFGLVFLEAMASGLPIVCYDYGGQTDFLSDNDTGYLVPLNDLESFTERCTRLIANPALRKAIGSNNLRLVEEFYIDRCASKYEAVFAQARGASHSGLQARATC